MLGGGRCHADPEIFGIGKSLTVERQKKTQGPTCFSLFSPHNKQHSIAQGPSGDTYSMKMGKRRGPKKAADLQRAQDFHGAFVGRAGGTWLPSLGFIAGCLQGWLCHSRKPRSPQGEVPIPWDAALENRATTDLSSLTTDMGRTLQPMSLPKWTL